MKKKETRGMLYTKRMPSGMYFINYFIQYSTAMCK